MNDRTGILAGLAGIGLVVLCCGGPLLIGAIGALSASALLGWATHIVLPAVGAGAHFRPPLPPSARPRSLR